MSETLAQVAQYGAYPAEAQSLLREAAEMITDLGLAPP
jgi:hypothetical protein